MSRSATRGPQDYVSDYNDAVQATRCYFCPARHDLQTHHIVPQRKNGSDNTENLVIVCDDCHTKLERLYDQRFYNRLGLSDDRGDERTHFACLITDCDTPATMQLRTGADDTEWFCPEHGERALSHRNAKVLKEVSPNA